jgi:Galactose oxidase, central domain
MFRLRELLLFLLLSGYGATSAQAQGVFIRTGDMNAARAFHTATLLASGQVLISGGRDVSRPGQPVLSTAELFDPRTGTFTSVGNMTMARSEHTATLLPDGRVLIAGGDPGPSLSTAELYDPSSRTFTRTTGDVVAPAWHTASLLDNGKVLIGAPKPQLFDPATGTFSATGEYVPMASNPYGQAGLYGPATLLFNGKILMAFEPSAQLYDPGTGTFSLTDTMATGRGFPHGNIDGRTATLLRNGKVLLTGGMFEDPGDSFADAELYDPAIGRFTSITKMSRTRSRHTATLLRDGTVLLAGGDDWIHADGVNNSGSIPSTEIYDPDSNRFYGYTGNMTVGRYFHTATLLMDGRVLLAGGITANLGSPNSASAEIYTPSILMPIPVVETVRFDRSAVPAGGSYSVELSGSYLSSEMFFDVRLISPGSSESAVVLNWQRGSTGEHDVPAGITPGNWTINGVRAHEIETDHTSNFFPVSATITVSP